MSLKADCFRKDAVSSKCEAVIKHQAFSLGRFFLDMRCSRSVSVWRWLRKKWQEW